MNTITDLSSYKEAGKSNLKIAESIALNKAQMRRMERTVNISLILLEYFIYVALFILLYKWRVVEQISILNPATWLEYSPEWFLDYVFLVCIIFVLFFSILANGGHYRLHNPKGIVDSSFRIFRAILVSFLIGIGIVFFMKNGATYSRVLIVLLAGSMTITAIALRILKKMIIHTLVKTRSKTILIVGAGKVGNQLASLLSSKSSGHLIVGFLDDSKVGFDVLGRIDQLEAIIDQYKVNEVYITIPSEKKLINQCLSTIRKYDIEIKIIPEMFDLVSSTLKFNKSEMYPFLEIVKTPLTGTNLLLKRLVDIIVSLMGLIIILPLLLVIALCIKLDSKGPVFFKQKRIGKNGLPFYMYKFRSMVVDAEALKAKLQKENEAHGPVFKIKHDPRITKFGRFIRKYSIDELPQLINVLIGDMSLIGPRPPLPDEVEQYDNYQWRRLEIVPGITGLWQVSGRSDLPFEDWVKLDIYYVENWSIALDISIIFRTIPVVLLGKGAY